MREKIARFMQGRYGVDELARFLTGFSMVWIVLELITRNRFFEILILGNGSMAVLQNTQ